MRPQRKGHSPLPREWPNSTRDNTSHPISHFQFYFAFLSLGWRTRLPLHLLVEPDKKPVTVLSPLCSRGSTETFGFPNLCPGPRPRTTRQLLTDLTIFVLILVLPPLGNLGFVFRGGRDLELPPGAFFPASNLFFRCTFVSGVPPRCRYLFHKFFPRSPRSLTPG